MPAETRKRRPPPKKKQVAPAPEPEAVKIYRWRLERFKELGFALKQAQDLADSTADWHDVETALKSDKCDHELAWKTFV